MMDAAEKEKQGRKREKKSRKASFQRTLHTLCKSVPDGKRADTAKFTFFFRMTDRDCSASRTGERNGRRMGACLRCRAGPARS